ncbi:transferase [Streptomyces sp. MS2.AVA.5]|uniref:Transferase n=1 Tax=Streptomyces achmelvichensis TaxID=3134111 RepID=A0ACC6Q8V0_9ACTN
MARIQLSDFITSPVSAPLAGTPYGAMEGFDLADFLDAWDKVHAETLALIPRGGRIHPTAFVHPTAIIGDDVIIGPRARVYEFSTVRKGSVLAAGASVGFNCEVTRSFLGEGAVLGHRIGVNTSLIGADAHLSANVTVAAISVWSEDMRRPEKEIRFRAPDGGLYRCGTPAFGALIGDRVQTGNSISLGPGVCVGRDARLLSGVTVAARSLPARCVVSAPHVADVHVRLRRRP